VLWVVEATFMDLPRGRRADLVRFQAACGRGAVPSVRRWSDVVDDSSVLRAQADGHRFVWWPSLLASSSDRVAAAVLSRVVRSSPDGAAPAASPSRHREVPRSTWAACAAADLPAARELAGSFPLSSGPNCFGTVLAAAGVPGAATSCVVEDTFLGWLASRCRPSPPGRGADDTPGTVFVWRDARSVPVHAAVTIGDGWVLEKASGEWWTPRAVRPVAEVVRATRLPGQHLERHRLVPAD
jgi:hypothetical protein